MPYKNKEKRREQKIKKKGENIIIKIKMKLIKREENIIKDQKLKKERQENLKDGEKKI